MSDLTHSLRRALRAPGFAAAAVLTLALGIGANTAIFSVVRTVLLQPLPYGNPDRLVMVWGALDRGETTWLSGPEVRSYVEDTRVFSSVASYTSGSANLTGGQEPERVALAAVSPNLFQTLGVPPHAGRAFTGSDTAALIADHVVLGHGLWQRRFGGSSDIIGQTIQVNGEGRLVIGVMPESFRLPLEFNSDRPSEIWVPLDERSANLTSWGNHSLIGVARLADGLTERNATSAMRALEEQWVRDGNWSNRDGAGRAAIPLHDLVLGDVRYALWVLLGAVGVILLIACANVANLMLARSDERHREVAVRAALGASRARIVRQLLTESTLLAAAGGVLGAGLAWVGMRLMLAVRPEGVPRLADATIDGAVLAFTAVLTIATGALFGLAPALQLSKPDLNRSLKEGGRGGTVGRGRQRFRDGLVVVQMAFSVVLLIGAALLIRSFVELRRIDLGFDERNALTVRTTLMPAAYPNGKDVVAFIETLRQRLALLPGVRSVGATRLLPLTGTIGDWSITIDGRPRAQGENPNGDWQVVTPGYFETMGMRLVRGRFFAETDDADAPITAVINETMANRYWPGDDAIGKRYHLGTNPRPWITVVGIVGQVRHNALTESARAEMYVPHGQWSAAGAGVPRAMTFVVRTDASPLAVLPYVRETVRSMDPSLPLADVRTLEDVARSALAQARFTTTLLALFATLALALAAIGIYGVVALVVTRRQQEIGVRMALGARPAVILGMILRRGMALAGAGMVVGIVAAALVTGVVSSMLYGVTRFDPMTFAVVPLLLAGVALLACLIPARRAARLDPVEALRE